MMKDNIKQLQKRVQLQKTAREKIREFSKFFYSKEDRKLRILYKEFLSLSLLMPKSEVGNFHAEASHQYFIWFENIIKDGVTNKELCVEALSLSKGLFCVAEGIFIENNLVNKQKLVENDLNEFIDTIFDMMEIA